MSAGAPDASIRIDRKILQRPSSGGAAPAGRAFAATRRESGRNYFRVDSRPPSSGSRPAGRHAASRAFSCVSAAAGAASAGTSVRYGRHRRASGLSRLRFAPRQPDRDPVPVTAGDTAHAGCGTLRRCDASRYLRGAAPVAATRGCASRNLTGSGARRHTDARRPLNTTSPDASPGDGDQAGPACGHPMGACPGSAARRRSECRAEWTTLRLDARSSPVAPPPSVAAAVRWSHGSGMPSHLDIERAKHTHRSQPRQRRTTASSPPCENLTAATTKLLCGVAAANISSGRQRRAGGHSYATWLNASAILLPSRGM